MRLVQEQHEQREQQEHHQYQERQIQLTLHQVSRFAACCIIAAFFIFIAGFYWGKKSITEVVLEEAAERLLADKIRAALYITHEEAYKKAQEHNQEQLIYNLHLGMFPTRKAAQACIETLKLLDCPAHIQQRVSTTAQGKQYIWYEIVTPAGKTHAEIKALQARIENSIKQQKHIQAYIQTHSIGT